MTGFRKLSLALAIVTALADVAPAQTAPGGERRQTLSAPAPDGTDRLLPISLQRPPGRGPFPLVVINHGSPSARERPQMAMPTFPSASNWFLAKGYAVALPLRRGYGAVGGTWNEGYGACGKPDFHKAGTETAKDIEASLKKLLEEADIAKQGVLIVGQSAGGWGTLAFSTRPHSAVVALINFAGGRGGHRNSQPGENCSPDALVKAAGEFGRNAKSPMLWIYTENDSYFSPAIARSMHKAFTGNGGKAQFHMLAPFEEDGHRLLSRKSGVAVWEPVVAPFIAPFMATLR
jgi:dienelactone hydrolase